VYRHALCPNDLFKDKGVVRWVVPITLAIATALAWAVTYLEQTGKDKTELKLSNAVHSV
jgi:hypothetical protein